MTLTQFPGYYAPIFKTFQQKEISGLLTRLWQNDPFKAKWSIIAKAYSMIREHKSKDMAPLDMFLELVCPLVGMVGRDNYLAVMGWVIGGVEGERKMERRFIPEIATFPAELLSTSLSADQVVAHCYQAKYTQESRQITGGGNSKTSVMAMAAQPPSMTSHVQSSSDFIVQPSSATHITEDLLAWLQKTGGNYPLSTYHNSVNQPAEIQQAADASPSRVQNALNTNNNDAVGPSADLRQTVHDFNQTGSQYPYNDHFDPYSSDNLSFDPFAGDQDFAYSTSLMGTYVSPNDTMNPDTFDIEQYLSDDIFNLNE